MEVKRFDSTNTNVFKYVFDFGSAVAESVLYRYESFYKRTVLCISVQSGCPVGCSFCGTGKQFIRNLTSQEIVGQVYHVLGDMGITDINYAGERFQIMFMSMGEPLLNFNNVEVAIRELNTEYRNADLLVSTMAPRNNESFSKLIELSSEISKVGLQFSIHESIEEKRNALIPFKNKLSLREIRDMGLLWNKRTSRPVYLNYCVNSENQNSEDTDRLKDLFSPLVFSLTFSVVCSSSETMKEAGYRNLDAINSISQNFGRDGYNVRIFDPAGQDDIGGGCGQLWYVQQWMKNKSRLTTDVPTTSGDTSKS